MIDLSGPVGNGAIYDIELCRDTGERIALLDRVLWFNYVRVYNAVGSFSIELPHDFTANLIQIDQRINIWRKPPGGPKRLEFAGILKTRSTGVDESGLLHRVIGGPCLNWLLGSRVVLTNASVIISADDYMKNRVIVSLGGSGTYPLPSSLFSVQEETGQAPVVVPEASIRSLIDLLLDLAQSSTAQGTPLFFEIAAVGDENKFQFRTYANQPGLDRTASGPIFALEFGNLANPLLIEEYAEEVNYVSTYYLSRELDGPIPANLDSKDQTRYRRSIFARREEGMSIKEPAAVADEGWRLLNAGRPRKIFTATFKSVPGSLYGVHWYFGDRVPVVYDNKFFEAVIKAVAAAVDSNGLETIESAVEVDL